MLNCGLHLCPQKCHQLHDHSKVPCEHVMRDKCPNGHARSWKCHKPPPKSCSKCEADARRIQKEMQKALELQEKRDREEQEYLRQIAKIDALLEDERQRIKDAQMSKERAQAVQQKEQDLANAKALTGRMSKANLQPKSTAVSATPVESSQLTGKSQLSTSSTGKEPSGSNKKPATKDKRRQESNAREEWEYQKRMENVSNDNIDSLMEMIGLEEVKLQVLSIKAKIDLSVRQGSDMKEDRLNVVFLGNPGTGKLYL